MINRNKQLLSAAEKNDIAGVKDAISNGANINCTTCAGGTDTPLYYAANKGFHEVVKILLDAGAYPGKVNGGNDDSSPLYRAIINGHENVVRVMVTNDFNSVDVNTVLYRSTTLLKCAAYEGEAGIVQLLLDNKADLELGGSALGSAICCCKNVKFSIVRLLVAAGSNVNAIDEFGQTPLHNAVRMGSFDIVKFLVEHGADINILDNFKKSAAHIAADKGNREIFTFLKSVHDQKAKDKLQSRVSSNSLFSANVSEADAKVNNVVSDSDKLISLMKSDPVRVVIALRQIDETLVNKVLSASSSKYCGI